MADELQGLNVAILATSGVEQVELQRPQQAVEDAGARTEVISLRPGQFQAMQGGVDKGDKIDVDRVIGDVDVDDYDALLLPGGVLNPDNLRQDPGAVRFVRDFFGTGKPVGVICHGPWTMVEADVVRDRTLTSFVSVRTDIRNAGGNVVDEEVVVDGALVSSRTPDDLPAFCAKVIEVFAARSRRTDNAQARA